MAENGKTNGGGNGNGNGVIKLTLSQVIQWLVLAVSAAISYGVFKGDTQALKTQIGQHESIFQRNAEKLDVLVQAVGELKVDMKGLGVSVEDLSKRVDKAEERRRREQNDRNGR